MLQKNSVFCTADFRDKIGPTCSPCIQNHNLRANTPAHGHTPISRITADAYDPHVPHPGIVPAGQTANNGQQEN